MYIDIRYKGSSADCDDRIFDVFYVKLQLKNNTYKFIINLPTINQIKSHLLRELLKTLIEISLASIIISKIGVNFDNTKIVVKIDGYFNKEIKDMCEKILNIFAIARTSQINKQYSKIEISAKDINFIIKQRDFKFNRDLAVIGWSGGMDSTCILLNLMENNYEIYSIFYEYYKDKGEILWERAAIDSLYNKIHKKYSNQWQHSNIQCNIYSLIDIPFLTNNPNIDNDNWEFYGRNFLTAVLLLIEALKRGAKYIFIGHTNEGLFHTMSKNGRPIYDLCCQSIVFIKVFNQILENLFPQDPPQLICPLAHMKKGSIARYLMKYPNILSEIRSCVNDDLKEDGACFSCHDKITSILSILNPNRLKITYDETTRLSNLEYEGINIATFIFDKEVDMVNNGLPFFSNNVVKDIWAYQLERLIALYPDIDPELEGSKFQYQGIISALLNLEGKIRFETNGGKIWILLDELRAKMGADKISKIRNDYIERKIPLSPHEFINCLSDVY